MRKSLLLIFSFLVVLGCKSEKSNQINHEYFNGYWLSKLEREQWRFHNINNFQDSVVNIFYVDIGYFPERRFEIFPNDSIGISWNYDEEDEYFTKSKVTIINENLFLASGKNFTDSLFRISKYEADSIIKFWEDNTTIEIELPRNK